MAGHVDFRSTVNIHIDISFSCTKDSLDVLCGPGMEEFSRHVNFCRSVMVAILPRSEF